MIKALRPSVNGCVTPYRGWEIELEILESFDDIRLLNVVLSRLSRWYRDGLLCIGDAAHAMSPAGGVGINLAVQDAVAAGRILAKPLLTGQRSHANTSQGSATTLAADSVDQTFQRLAHRVVVETTIAEDEASRDRLRPLLRSD